MYGYCHNMSSVCLSWRECIVSKWLKLGSCSFHCNVAQCRSSLPAGLMTKFGGVPSTGGTNYAGIVFEFAMHAISRKLWEIDLRWQLITNRKSYKWAFDCNKSRWPWMTLSANLLLCRKCYTHRDQTAEARITRFSLWSSTIPQLSTY